MVIEKSLIAQRFAAVGLDYDGVLYLREMVAEDTARMQQSPRRGAPVIRGHHTDNNLAAQDNVSGWTLIDTSI